VPRALRRLAPVLVAAAVVAVVLPTFAFLDHPASTAVPLQQVGEPVDVDPVAARDFRPDDAGLPVSSMALPDDPNLRACEAAGLTATLDLAAGRVLIEPPRATACRLPADLHVQLPTGVTVKEDVQPDVPNPPGFGGRFLQSTGVAFNTSWSGSCDALPNAGSVVGGELRIAMTVTGTPASCGTGDGALRVGPAHQTRAPGAIVPTDRAGLVVSLELPDEVDSGAAFTYRVTLGNPTDDSIALRPCPTFTSLTMGPAGGGGGPGRLPCDKLPDRLEAHTKVVLVMHASTFVGPAATTESRAEGSIRWGIAGTEDASGSLTVVQRAPKALPPVPYLAPSGTPPPKSSFRYPGASGAFPIVLDGPARVHAGDVLRYRAVFTNRTGGPVVSLEPCPPWTELMAQAPKVTDKPDIIERSGAVNCTSAPKEIRPGEQVAFEMERLIGPDTPPGAYQIYWQFGGVGASAPFDLEVIP
jgi:hypothetical protein